MPARSCRWLWLLALTVLLGTGCATAPLQYPELEPPKDGEARQVVLSDTPFYPQTAYQCGPAALATVLQTSGVAQATPDRLAEQIYLPGRRGSLQTELVAATRRAGRVPYVLEPRMEHLFRELRAGNPVLVLQNLKLPRWPQWHYAVVIGFDTHNKNIFLRSGKEQRQTLSWHRFERTWQMGDYWALVVTPPGETPATATAPRYLQAVVPLEQQERWHPAAKGYRTAAKRWPDNPASYLGLGNIAFQTEDYIEAAAQFRQAVKVAPQLPAAHYNLAWALLHLGEIEQARRASAEAQALAPEHPRFGQAVKTLEAAASDL
ncbi:PA2778 family cysteine peptidase [Marinimicrobium locisalis]|uniref:PA2778 family cysteine peptidase n=1 Tax=Marinimicrobium locisalis TaxID=546022 RepID=UPI0032219BE9